MVIDFHTHLFPASICSDRECYCEADPAFELLYHSATSRLVSTSELLAAMDADGVDSRLFSGFPGKTLRFSRCTTILSWRRCSGTPAV